MARGSESLACMLRGLSAALLVAACAAGPGPTQGTPPGTASASPSVAPLSPASTAAQSVPPATSDPAATSDPGATSDPAASGSPVGPVWQYLTGFPAEGAVEVASVVATATGFVAAGFEPAPGQTIDGRMQGVIWRSEDGRSWQRTADPSFANATLVYILSLRDVLYLFGHVSVCPFDAGDDCVESENAGINVWRSPDGVAWERLPQPPSMKDALLDGVAAGQDVMAVHGSAGDELVATLWLSADGAAWSELTDLAGLDPINTMASGPPGFAAFGTHYLDSIDAIEALAAHSADGRSFAGANLPGGLPRIDSVAWGAAGFVGVGHTDGLESPVVSTAVVSLDGVNWTVAPAEGTLASAGLSLVHPVPTGYVAIGFDPATFEFDTLTGRSWHSADGLAWAPLAALDGGVYQQLGGSVAGADGIVVFATEFDESGDALVAQVHGWFAPLARLSAP